MNKITVFIVATLGIFLILMGIVFMIAYEADIMNLYLGVVMIVVGLTTFLFIFLTKRAEARRPTLVQQNINVTMGGSGRMAQRQLKCKTCGAPLEDKDLNLVSGGIVYTCSYCGAAGQFEEEPKW